MSPDSHPSIKQVALPFRVLRTSAAHAATVRYLTIGILAVAAVAGSCVAYARARYLYNPLVPILAMVVAAALAAAATSFRRRVLG